MKDFVKIFSAVSVLVGVFLYGRKYGEDNFKQTEEYQALVKAKEEQGFTKNDLENAKIKFQNIIDGAETKKADELLGQILQIFLADLGLKIQNQKTFAKECVPTQEQQKTPLLSQKPAPAKEEIEVKKDKRADYRKLKSREWILQNSRDDLEIKKNLKNVEIKDMTSFLETTSSAKISKFENIFGSYRGRLFSVDDKEFSTLILEIKPYRDGAKEKVHIRIAEIRQGKTSERNSDTDEIGFISNSSNSFLLNYGESNKFYQIYKISETNQLAGYFYEQLVNGTTKTIGSFVLNRVDQF